MKEVKHFNLLNHLYDLLEHGQIDKASQEIAALEGKEIKTCETCAWWGNELLGHHGPPSHKTCDHNRKTECAAIDGMDISDSEGDNSNTFCQITTGPKFGCVNHMPK